MVGVTGLVLVAATAVTLRQQQANEELRTQVTVLQSEATATTRLREESRRQVATRTQEEGVAAAEHAELVKLRAEKAAYLKAVEARAWAGHAAGGAGGGRAAAENGALAPGMLPIEAMTDVGRATPSAAAQTMLWALQRGDVKGAATVLEFAPAERAKLEGFIATLPENIRQEYGTPEQMIAFVMSGSPKPIAGVQLLTKTQPDADTEIHRVQVQYKNGEVRQDDITFRREADGWKQVVSPRTVDGVIAYFKGKQ
ncbi:MAG: hypothetical protein NTV51_05450 [Verrucomicrobia bacterium]|nr:hypothetical protein [Verrucomicrobiota bacterium]